MFKLALFHPTPPPKLPSFPPLADAPPPFFCQFGDRPKCCKYIKCANLNMKRRQVTLHICCAKLPNFKFVVLMCCQLKFVVYLRNKRNGKCFQANYSVQRNIQVFAIFSLCLFVCLFCLHDIH